MACQHASGPVNEIATPAISERQNAANPGKRVSGRFAKIVKPEFLPVRPNCRQKCNRHKRPLLSPLLLAVLLLLAGPAWAGTLSVVGQSRWVQVAHVFDGDTFRTGSGERVRLLGINAPEVAHNNRPGQPYGAAARRWLRQLIQGQTVQLKLDRDPRDQYGRTLAQVYLRDGRWVNRMLIEAGLAQVYTFAPNFYWTDALLRAERIARRDMRGLWKSERFRILDAGGLSARHIGQFRLVRGHVDARQGWRFRLGSLMVSVPRSARSLFSTSDLPAAGQKVIVRGVIRISHGGQRYLALHSPYDMR
jgi:endonuclease YncB( thermonuclease family)